jgi:hypothetical protein
MRNFPPDFSLVLFREETYGNFSAYVRILGFKLVNEPPTKPTMAVFV